jgi:hypothetical protein
MIDVGEELRSWGFDFILTGYHRADIACQQRDNFCCCISISKIPVSQMPFDLSKPLKNNTFLI